MSAKFAASYLAERYRDRLRSLDFRKTGGHGRYDLDGGTVIEEWTANDGRDVRLVYVEVGPRGALKRAILFEPGEERP